MVTARRWIGLLGLLALTSGWHLPAAAAPAITYLDMDSQWPGGVRASADEEIRLWVSGSGCRSTQYDSAPVVTGGVIEFSLAFGSVCFATPPPFLWTADIGPLQAGTYAVNYYGQSQPFPDGTTSPKYLLARQYLMVGPRPDPPEPPTPGLADPSFGTDGVLRNPGVGSMAAIRMKMQTGGRVVAGSPSLISRLTDSGAIDGGFAAGGRLQPGDQGTPLSTGAMTIGTNDQILFAGRKYDANYHPQFVILRYSSRGDSTGEILLDPSALTDGAVHPTYSFLGNEATEVAVLPDGRIVAAAFARDYANDTPSRWFVLRFAADGTLDPSFGNAGIYTGPSSGYVHRVVSTADDGLLLLGTDSELTPATFLMKLDATGQPDISFGQGGFVYGAFARSAPLVQDDGTILVGQSDFSILKLRSNGIPDVLFGNQGVLTNRTGIPLLLQDFLRQDDGKLLLVGAQLLPDPFGSPLVMRYQPVLTRYTREGSLDANFGADGVAEVDVMTVTGINTSPIEAMSLLRLPNGKGLLAVSEGRGAMYIYRFQGDNNLPALPNYQGLWWNAPAGSEAGWGMNFAHQGDLIFASWFTYDLGGKPWWLAMTAGKTTDKAYTGSLYQVDGPPFDAAPFPPIGQPGGATGSVVGEATLTFGDENNATFAYSVNGIAQSKAITRQAFGLLPNCAFGTTTNLALATNYQDLWWAAPAGSEAGWGINLAHQGDTIFATWFTYDHDRTPMWLVVTAARTASKSYTGDLYRATSGPPFSAVPFPPLGSPGGVTGGIVGSATFTFNDGNTGTFAYTVSGIRQSKSITREVFALPGTTCR
jgi:uncharacterized delta-60 repeat protein